MSPPRILIIAGSDSGGGAGIQADIKTVTMLGGYAMTAITTVTAQNTVGVQAAHPLPPELVIAQIDSCLSDIGVDAIKIGMIGSAATADAVADRLAGVGVPVVFDPVMVATSGAVLADARTIAAFGRLMSIARVTTPNLPEAEALGGPAAILRHGSHVALKGGHGDGARITDQLLAPDGDLIAVIENERIDTTSTHGTGCTFASALAVGLASDQPISRAFEQAVRFVRLAIRDAPGFSRGNGPLGHASVRLDCGAGARLNQVSIAAEDPAATKAFYLALGLTPIVESTGNGYQRFEAAGGATLSAYPGGDGIYFERDDLDLAVTRLQSEGLVFDDLPADRSWGWREAWLRDPAGNRICLFDAGENRRYPPWRL